MMYRDGFGHDRVPRSYTLSIVGRGINKGGAGHGSDFGHGIRDPLILLLVTFVNTKVTPRGERASINVGTVNKQMRITSVYVEQERAAVGGGPYRIASTR